MADVYREMYPTHAIAGTTAMAGAHEAIAAVQDAGGRAVVVTAKYEPNAKLHLKHLGIVADAVICDLWAERKAEAPREYGAGVYVGDHTGDVRGARIADALSVAVATGPCDAEELRTAGADVVLADLAASPAWLDRYQSWTSPGPLAAYCTERARRRCAATVRSTPAAAIRKPTPISMLRPNMYAGKGDLPSSSGATVTRVATAPTKKTMPPVRTSRSPGSAEFAWVLSRTRPG